ncbi:5401_t:CDS:1, partial [Paraglomus occultum]
MSRAIAMMMKNSLNVEIPGRTGGRPPTQTARHSTIINLRRKQQNERVLDRWLLGRREIS